jgi:hypothetical protein
MKKAVLFAVVLALAAMAVEPVGWLLAGKPVRWIHRGGGRDRYCRVRYYRRGVLVDWALAQEATLLKFLRAGRHRLPRSPDARQREAGCRMVTPSSLACLDGNDSVGLRCSPH